MNTLTTILTDPLTAHLARGLAWLGLCLVGSVLLRRLTGAASVWRFALLGVPLLALMPLLPGTGLFRISEPVREVAVMKSSLENPAKTKAVPVEALVVTVPTNARVGASSATQARAISWARIVFGIWSAGVAVFLVRALRGRWRLRKFDRKTEPLGSARWRSCLRELVAELGLRHEPGLVTHPDSRLPVTWGWHRPRILIPALLVDSASPSEIDMILRHELHHISRRDSLFQSLAEFCRVLHWPNPLAWLAPQWLHRVREQEADSAVLAGGHAPADYADLLVRLASGHDDHTPAIAVAMARSSTVPSRVESILSEAPGSGGAGLARILILILGACGLVIGTTAIGDPSELETRVFRIDPQVRQHLLAYESELDSEVDPFAPQETFSEIFKKLGVEFPEGSKLLFNPKTAQMVVRNSAEQVDLIQVLIDGATKAAAKQKADRQVHIVTKIVEGAGLIRDDIPGKTAEEAPKEGVVGVFTDPQLQVVLRALSKVKGANIVSAPSIVTRNAQRGTIEIGWNEEARTGLKLSVEPTVSDNGFTIDLDLDVSGHPRTSVTIWDGQTVALQRRIGKDRYETALVTARVIDNRGVPIHPVPQPEPDDPEPAAAREKLTELRKTLAEKHPKVIAQLAKVRELEAEGTEGAEQIPAFIPEDVYLEAYLLFAEAKKTGGQPRTPSPARGSPRTA